MSLIPAIAVYLYVWHTAQEVGSLFWCHEVVSLQFTHVRYFACRCRLQKLLSGLFDRYSLLRNNNMTTNLPRCSYGRRRFSGCDCWTHTSLAENAARQWLLLVVSFVVLYCAVWKEAWMKKKHCCANEARFLVLLPQQQGRNEVRWGRDKKQVWRPYACTCDLSNIVGALWHP